MDDDNDLLGSSQDVVDSDLTSTTTSNSRKKSCSSGDQFLSSNDFASLPKTNTSKFLNSNKGCPANSLQQRLAK
jgi:hypothetical protein